MSTGPNQFNYPLSPDFIPEKKPARLKAWFLALQPKHKILTLVIATVVLGVAVYFGLALTTNKMYFKFSPESGTLFTKQTQEIKIVFVAPSKSGHLNPSATSLTYTGTVKPGELSIVSTDDRWVTSLEDGKINIRLKMTLNYQAKKEYDVLTLAVTPTTSGNLKITSPGTILFLAANEANFDIVDLSSDNIIYIAAENGRELQENVSQILALKAHTTKDIVAFAAQLKYDPAKLKVEVVSMTGAFTFNIPADERNDVAAGTYSVVRGTYGDGQPNNGTITPNPDNPVGFNGDATVGLIKITPLEQTDVGGTDLKVLSSKFVWDDSNGTMADVAGYTLNLKIVPEVPISEQLNLTILESDYQCTKTASDYKLTVTWRTNKAASGRLSIGNNVANDEQASLSHTLTLVVGNIKAGTYTISGETEKEKVENADQAYDCEELINPLKIRDLLVKAASNSAEVTFLTVGGGDDGAVKGKISQLERKEGSAWTKVDCTGCDGVDIKTTNLHKFNLTGLRESQNYRLTVAASDNADTVSSLVTFNTKPKETTKNTNVVLQVERDRTCDSWLYCRSAAQIKNSKDKLENLCFDVGLCNELDDSGACVSPVDLGALGVSGANQTFSAPQAAGAAKADEAEARFKNLSGFSKVGLDWGNGQVIEGLQHYAAMTTLGRNVNLPNSDFGSGNTWPWQGNDVGELNVVQDIFNNGNSQVINNVLQISVNQDKYDERVAAASNGAVYAGAKVPLGNITSGDNYILSFSARTKDESGKQILLQVKNGNVFSNFLGDSTKRLTVGGSPEQFVIKAGRKLTGGYTELIFNQLNSDSYSRDDFLKEFYIDSVSLQPVLQVQNKTVGASTDKYIARTCRLYPSASALGCETVDGSGKLYRGWKGFCVEPDPINPSLCLNWWPVDIIKGETDIFAAEAKAGYKDRKPLYYCLESAGKYPYVRTLKLGTGYKNGDKSGERVNGPLYTLTQVTNPVNGTKTTIAKGWTGQSGIFVFPGVVQYNLTEADIQQIVLTPQCAEDAEDCFSKSEKHPPIVLNRKNNWLGYLLTSGEAPKLETWSDYQTAFVCENLPDDFFGVGAFFENGKLTSFQAGLCNLGGDPGLVAYKTTIYLREKCNILVQVVDPFGKNYTWASRILNKGWTTGNDLGYQYGQDYTPYGAAVPPAENTNYPDLWKNPLYVMPPDASFGVAPYQVRAGSPYAIKTSDKQCTNPSKLGELCSVSADCNTFNSANQTEKGICEAKVNSGAECIMGSSESLGKACTTNYDCGYGTDGQSGLCMGITLTDSQASKIGGGYGGGADRLSQLFAKSLAAWVWAPELNRYLQVCSADKEVSCATSVNGMTCELLKSLCWNKQDVLGIAPEVKNITVNKVSGGQQEFTNFVGAVLRFNSSVSQDQLPLTAYRVDWGDDEVTEMTNLAIAPKTDINNPHVLMHTYTCQNEKSAGWNAVAGACIFIPKIQIQDNWEWCSRASNYKGMNLCSSLSADWTAFNGKIVVKVK
ncbi:MAG: hypothetical protein PHT40_01985 [Patescibacteria group bacterium]|nr:hypothetical protein [Patescibacteria group bacterium]